MRIITLFLLLFSFSAHASTVLLSWTDTKTRTDGKTIDPLEIKETKVYCGKTSGVYLPKLSYVISRDLLGNLANSLRLTLTDPAGTNYFCVATHVDTADIESAYSNEVSFTPDNGQLSPPGSLTVIIVKP